ncbi:hypothetical protein V5O48_017241 [Marasmius crinis-equi]|uniref:F-box domain-containing protein n=1 Tax=Marasmius crinis-equi TaxID=585013 RepID=A0ABR3EPH5_9AGAR
MSGEHTCDQDANEVSLSSTISTTSLEPSLISKLSDDLLLAIFDAFISIEDKPSLLSAAVTLARVCDAWEELVTAYLRFWTRIVFREAFNELDPPLFELVLKHLVHALQLKGRQPLTIESEGLIHTVLEGRYSRARQSSGRCSFLWFKFPRLERLNLVVDVSYENSDEEDSDDDSDGVEILLPGSSPSLKHVAIGIRTSDVMPYDGLLTPYPSVYFPWSQLTHLEIDAPHGINIFHSDDPGCASWNLDDPLEDPRFTFPNLTTLHAIDDPDLIASFHAPKLTDLVLTTNGDGYRSSQHSTAHDNAVALIEASQCIVNESSKDLLFGAHNEPCAIRSVEFRILNVGAHIAHPSVCKLLNTTAKLEGLKFSCVHIHSLLPIDWKELGNLPVLRRIRSLTLRLTENILVERLLGVEPIELSEEDMVELFEHWKDERGIDFVKMVEEQLASLTTLRVHWDAPSVHRDWYHDILPRIDDLESVRENLRVETAMYEYQDTSEMDTWEKHELEAMEAGEKH